MMYTYQEHITFDMPEAFWEFNEATKIEYFGNGHSIDVAFGDKETNRTMAWSINEIELTKRKVCERIQQYQRFYERMVLGFTMGKLAEKKENLHNIAIMTFKSNTPLHEEFNSMAVTNVHDKEFFFTCSCILEDAIENMGLFMNIINHLRFQDE